MNRATFLVLPLALAALPAEAAVNLTQVLVKSSEIEPVAAALAGREGRVAALAPRDGWVPVLLAGEDDARALSEALGTVAVWLEVRGTALSYRLAVYRGGAKAREHVSPRGPNNGVLPAYEDVELAAWRRLAKLGVPAAYRFLTAEELSPAKEGVPVVEIEAGERKEGAVTLAERRGPGPPRSIDAFLPMGETGKRGIDLLELEGEAKRGRLTRLAGVLLSIQKRYQGGEVDFCHIVNDPYRVPLYTVLARRKSPCQSAYRTLLDKAKKDAAIPEGETPKPPARRAVPVTSE